MRISTRTRYGFRLLINLAQHYGESVVQLNQIAEEEEISEKYLEQIVKPLKNAGILSSTRGAKGGYSLVKAPHEIDLFEIFELLEGQLTLIECIGNPKSCDRFEHCPTNDLWVRLNTTIADFFKKQTLQDLMDNYLKNKDTSMYII